MSWLILTSVILHGLYHVWHAPANDMECSNLDLAHAEMQRRYHEEFGGMIPRRMPYRLPLEYWLYAWAVGPSWGLHAARLLGLAAGMIGVWVTMQWGGSLAGVIVLSSPTIVRVLASATSVSWVATLWIGGLYALTTGHPVIAMGCGVLLALLRHTAWGMALWLLWASGGIVVASGLAAYLWFRHADVIRSNGWVRLWQGQPLSTVPHGGWLYALRIFIQRYEAWGAWLLAAAMLGHWNWTALVLLLLTGGLFAATHLPRMLIRPKWTVGYMPEWTLPIAVSIAMILIPS